MENSKEQKGLLARWFLFCVIFGFAWGFVGAQNAAQFGRRSPEDFIPDIINNGFVWSFVFWFVFQAILKARKKIAKWEWSGFGLLALLYLAWLAFVVGQLSTLRSATEDATNQTVYVAPSYPTATPQDPGVYLTEHAGRSASYTETAQAEAYSKYVSEQGTRAALDSAWWLTLTAVWIEHNPESTPTRTRAPTLTPRIVNTNTRAPTKPPTRAPAATRPPAYQSNCSPSYPNVCIPPAPPDLDCKDIPYKRFRVLSPDPHNFDSDGDGVGCE